MLASLMEVVCFILLIILEIDNCANLKVLLNSRSITANIFASSVFLNSEEYFIYEYVKCSLY